MRLSLAVSIALAAAALVVGIASGSRIIVFDGAYLSIGLLLTWASLRAAAVAAAGPSSRFPFGRDALAPLVVVGQALGIAVALVIAAADAIIVIRNGGSPADPVAIGVYGLVTAVAGFLIASVLRRRAGHSDIVVAEAAQWRSGSVLSSVMVLGAVALPLLGLVGLSDLARYVDPVLVLISCLILAAVPIGLMRTGMNELLEGAPPAPLSASIQSAVAAVQERFGLPGPVVRSGKVGQKLYVEVHFVVVSSEWSVNDEDAVRRAVVAELEPLGLDIWAYVAVTHDPGLVGEDR